MTLSHPVIPANAGTQKQSEERARQRAARFRARFYGYWVPAFAGITVSLMAGVAHAQRAPVPLPPPVRQQGQQQQAQGAANNPDRAERLRRNVEGSDVPEGTKRKGRMLVPAAFQGEWNTDLKACGTGYNDSRLIVGGDSLRFYESLGTVRRVAVESPTLIAVTADMAGEGSRWTDVVRLELTAPDMLAIAGSDAAPRRRCPATTGTR